MFQQLKTEKIWEILGKDELTEVIFVKKYKYINFSLNLQIKIVILNGNRI